MNIITSNNKIKELTKHFILSRNIQISLIFALILLLACYYYFSSYISTDDAYIEGHIVPISSKVPGYVSNIHVNDNQPVKKGDLLIEIDSKDYEIQVTKAKAILEATSAQYKIASNNYDIALLSIPSSLDSARATYESALAAHRKALADLERTKEIFYKSAETQQNLDSAIAAEKIARSQVEDAKAKLKSASPIIQELAAAEANTEQLKAQVKQAEADLSQAQLNLMYTKIYAPQDGKITDKSAEIGAYLQPGQTILSLVGNEFWIIANFKETQLAQIKPGAPTTIYIDAFPNISLSGKVDSIQAGTGSRLSLFPAENATGNFVKIVQRVPVKIVFDKPSEINVALAAGMSVMPKVKTR